MSKNTKNKYRRIADSDAQAVSDEKLRVSFEYIDWNTEEFFFHGMEVKYYQKMFACVCEISKCKESDITEQSHPSLSPKSIFNSSSSVRDSFPESIISQIQEKLFIQTRDKNSSRAQAIEIASRAFEVSLSKNYGRLHGFIWNNTFHIIWFDPAHNLYPMRSGITKHKDAATVKCFAPDEILRLQSKIKELQEENAELYEALG
ncbi:MAG: hypothetical protein F6K21_14175 [Symploca sp. SIO2D2]|nr:hypothetical protein [Symploca sp. SIO2D2]